MIFALRGRNISVKKSIHAPRSHSQMNGVKLVVRVIYRLLRVLFSPLILLFRPTGLRRESIVAVSALAVFIFVFQPLVASRVGADYEVAMTAAWAVLSCFL